LPLCSDDRFQKQCGSIALQQFWGVAKLVKAPDFDSGIRRFESFLLSQNSIGQARSHAGLPDLFSGRASC
jgi:hypothetical protein